jgi:hypothetical protein
MTKRKSTKGQTTIYKTPSFVNYKKGRTRLAAASNISLLVASLWSVVISGDSSSSNTKINCHDIAEILLKVALNTINQSINKFQSRTKTAFNSISCATLMLGCRIYYVNITVYFLIFFMFYQIQSSVNYIEL